MFSLPLLCLVNFYCLVLGCYFETYTHETNITIVRTRPWKASAHAPLKRLSNVANCICGHVIKRNGLECNGSLVWWWGPLLFSKPWAFWGSSLPFPLPTPSEGRILSMLSNVCFTENATFHAGSNLLSFYPFSLPALQNHVSQFKGIIARIKLECDVMWGCRIPVSTCCYYTLWGVTFLYSCTFLLQLFLLHTNSAPKLICGSTTPFMHRKSVI